MSEAYGTGPAMKALPEIRKANADRQLDLEETARIRSKALDAWLTASPTAQDIMAEMRKHQVRIMELHAAMQSQIGDLIARHYSELIAREREALAPWQKALAEMISFAPPFVSPIFIEKVGHPTSEKSDVPALYTDAETRDL